MIRALSVACPHCEATAGAPCRANGGHVYHLAFAHSARREAARNAAAAPDPDLAPIWIHRRIVDLMGAWAKRRRETVRELVERELTVAADCCADFEEEDDAWTAELLACERLAEMRIATPLQRVQGFNVTPDGVIEVDGPWRVLELLQAFREAEKQEQPAPSPKRKGPPWKALARHWRGVAKRLEAEAGQRNGAAVPVTRGTVLW